MTLGCQAFAARQWLSRRPEASSTLLGGAFVEVRSAGEGRGLGLYTIRSIEAFSQIMSDVPLILMRPGDDLPELYQQFQHLPSGSRSEYLSLSHQPNAAREALLKDKLLKRGFGSDGIEEMATVASIMQTNAFNVDMQDGHGSTHRALFAKIARINHSCTPNAHVCFHPPSDPQSQGRMAVHALRPLHPGDEVLIAYFSILLPRAERLSKAQKWGFTCVCPACAPTPPFAPLDSGEDLRAALRAFTAQQAHAVDSRRRGTTAQLDALLGRARTLVDAVLGTPELAPALPDVYDGWALLRAKRLLVRERGDEGRESVVALLECAAVWEARITGLESPATARRLGKVRQFAARQGQIERPRVVREDGGKYVVRWAGEG